MNNKNAKINIHQSNGFEWEVKCVFILFHAVHCCIYRIDLDFIVNWRDDEGGEQRWIRISPRNKRSPYLCIAQSGWIINFYRWDAISVAILWAMCIWNPGQWTKSNFSTIRINIICWCNGGRERCFVFYIDLVELMSQSHVNHMSNGNWLDISQHATSI